MGTGTDLDMDDKIMERCGHMHGHGHGQRHEHRNKHWTQTLEYCENLHCRKIVITHLMLL